MYKGKKYNILIICLLMVISVVIGTAGIPNTMLPNLDFTESEDEQIEGMFNTEEEPSLSNFKAPGPSANVYTRLEFAFNVLHNGAGYTSICSQNATGTVMGVASTQYIKNKKYRGGGLDISEEWCKINDFGLNLGRNDFRIFYCDGTTLRAKTLKGSNYNYDAETYNASANDGMENISVSSWNSKRVKINDYDVVLTKDTCEASEFKKPDDNFYYIKAVVKPEKIGSKYLQSFYDNGSSSVRIVSHVLKIRIHKKTGFLYDISKEEKIVVTQNGIANIETIINAKWVYKTMDKSAESEIRSKAKAAFGI